MVAKEIKLKVAQSALPDVPMLWFTSDTHFSHTNVIRHCNRPFADAHTMNSILTENWNTHVRPHDYVFHLGDFAMTGPKNTVEIVKKLNGRKYLVYGNHDLKVRHRPEFEQLFEGCFDIIQIKVEDSDAFERQQRITLCHYAMRVWNKSHYGSWQLFGHSHGSLEELPTYKSMDVGVDAIAKRFAHLGNGPIAQDYRPISYGEVKAIMATRVYKPVDHHQERM